LIPPVVAAPAFAIRKPAVAIFTLRDYASTGIMTSEQAEILRYFRVGASQQRRSGLAADATYAEEVASRLPRRFWLPPQ
jgi:type IV secretory pathway ATPase VirB11/archaellum biosynthesis ATPase